MSLFDRFSFRFGIFIYTGFNYCKPEEIQIRIKSLRSLAGWFNPIIHGGGDPHFLHDQSSGVNCPLPSPPPSKEAPLESIINPFTIYISMVWQTLFHLLWNIVSIQYNGSVLTFTWLNNNKKGTLSNNNYMIMQFDHRVTRFVMMHNLHQIFLLM